MRVVQPDDRQLFRSTARYYRDFRVPYPQALLDRLRSEAGDPERSHLLDLGCGTGELAVPLAPYFRTVTAVDPEAEMLDLARERGGGNDHITFVLGRAEDLNLPPASVDLVTIGAAFHWMDRALVARRCRQWLAPGRPMAVIGSSSIWSGTAPWQEVARRVLTNWFGERRAGKGVFEAPRERHEIVLAREGMRLEHIEFRTQYVWTLESFLSYLCSTSFASAEVVGIDRGPFERVMRDALLKFDPTARYPEIIVFYCILAYPKQEDVQ